jgi:hypothetical protein
MTDTPNITSVIAGTTIGLQHQQARHNPEALEKALKERLSDEQFELVQPFIGQLPAIDGKSPQQIAPLYASAVENLVDKLGAFSASASNALAQWATELQGLNTISSDDLFEQSNKVLSNEFQNWFSQQLTSKLDPYLPTGVVDKFKLVDGTVESQADQIGRLAVPTLKAKIVEITEFVDGLKKHLDSEVVTGPEKSAGTAQIRQDSLPFLRSAFDALAKQSLTLSQLKDSKFLLNAGKFSQKVSEQLEKQFNAVDVDLSAEAADTIAAKIQWLPGMSEAQLQSSVKTMVDALKGQFNIEFSADPSAQLKRTLETEVARLSNNSSQPETLGNLFANIAVSLSNTKIQAFYNNEAIRAEQKTQITSDQVIGIGKHVSNDIRRLFGKMVRGEPVEPAFKERYASMADNLKTLTDRLRRITPRELETKQISAGHVMTARDLLSVVDASIANRFDEQVLFSMNERRVNRLEKRDKQKAALQELTARLKVFGKVQSKIHGKQSEGEGYNPAINIFTYEDFGYTSNADFAKSPEFKYLSSIKSDPDYSKGMDVWVKTSKINSKWEEYKRLDSGSITSFLAESQYKAPKYKVERPVVYKAVPEPKEVSGEYTKIWLKSDNIDTYIKPEFRDEIRNNSGPVSHFEFLQAEDVDPKDQEYKDSDKVKYLSNFSSSISDQSKLLNDEVQIKTTELNDTSSQYNSTVEAMNKFVQKYHSILEQILRSI